MHEIVRRRAFAFLAAALLCGCGFKPVRETPLNDLIEQSAQLSAKGYRIEVGDVLTVRFYFNPELDFDVPVRPDGSISLSLIGDVAAAGHSTQDLSASITAAYKDHLNNPSATVIVRSPTGHRVFVTGEVNYPGIFGLQGTETVLSALAMAGGLGDRGSFKQIVIIRRLPEHPAPMVAVLNLKRALDGSDPRQDVRIYVNDIIYIPRTGSAQTNVVLQNLIWGKAPVSGYASVGYSGSIK